MLNNNDTLTYLQGLGLSRDESKLYIELLRGPNSHLELARATGINRTKIYRLADDLEKRSLISTQTDDRGTMLIAADPSTLEVEIVTKEEALKNQRAIYTQLVPHLEKVKRGNQADRFSIQTYEGVEGFKQMLWHELKTKDEILMIGGVQLEELVQNKRWSEKHRAMTVEAGYNIREILNPDTKTHEFTANKNFLKHYKRRHLAAKTLLLDNQLAIYNDTVSTYCWQNGQKVGVEIINRSYAAMMRQMFEHYWQLAETIH